MRQHLGPAHDGVSGEDGSDDSSESVANVGIGISDVAEGQSLDILQDIIPDITGVDLNVSLEQKSSNQASRRKLLRHLRQDVDEVVVVIGDISERLELLRDLMESNNKRLENTAWEIVSTTTLSSIGAR